MIRAAIALKTPLRLGLVPRLVALVVLMAVATGGIVGAIVLSRTRTALRTSTMQSALAAADLAAQFTAKYLEAAAASLQDFAGRPTVRDAVRTGNWDLLNAELARTLATNPRLDSINLYDASGMLQATGLGNPPEGIRSATGQPWFMDPIVSGQPQLGTPTLSAETQRPVVPYGVPVVDPNRRVLGVVGANISLPQLSEVITGLRIAPSARTSLVDMRRGGLFLAHDDANLLLQPIPAEYSVTRRLFSGARATVELPDRTGQLVLAAFSPVPDLPWGVLIEQPAQAAFAILEDTTRQVLGLGVLVTLSAAAIGVGWALQTTRPLVRLRGAAIALAAGEQVPSLNVSARDEVGELSRAFIYMADTLSTKEHELRNRAAELRSANDQLAAAAQELQALNRSLEERVVERTAEAQKRTLELERSNAELQQFAYVASHDLQEPLRMVASYTQLLARRYQGRLDSDADEFIAFAVDGANRMQGLIQDLLLYSRVGTQGRPLVPTDTGAVCDQAIANLSFAIAESGAEVTCDPLPTVRADATQLGQVFQNLIGNAIKYRGDRPPRIHVSARPEGDQFVFAVADNGIGINAKYAERIFMIFQRLHTRAEYPGTGIGLAICKRIVERHGGRIWLTSEPGQGTTFLFTLPQEGAIEP